MRAFRIAHYLLLAVAAMLPLTAHSANEPIKIASRGDANALYAIKAMELAMEKMGHPFELEVSDKTLSAMRMRAGALDGDIDVIWTATNNELEEQFIPVRVPLYKGLLGFRICIIHKDNKEIFKDVRTMDDAKKFTYGQGRGWTDTTILRASGLTVIDIPKYHGLFHMTDGKRFDAYPRGVHEPWTEIADRPELELTVDENLLFVYKMPYYLMVPPRRPEVAEALEEGLLRAVEDGSFDKMFLENELVQMVLERANIESRRSFDLINPDLPPETPLDNPKLWFDPLSLKSTAHKDAMKKGVAVN